MCNIGLKFHQNGAYKFVFAANRDEAYRRPTKSAHFWKDHPELLAGQDELQKGTWLGLTKQGKFAALTNCRKVSTRQTSEDPQAFLTSRGTLVKNFLTGDQTAAEYADDLINTRHQYDGYNLIFGNILEGQFLHYNNSENQLNELTPGTHGLSNATLDTPWPKVATVTSRIKQLSGSKEQLTDQLFALFSDEQTAPKEALPKTGLPIEFEEAASAIFIRTKEYGTIGTTVILVDQENHVTFVERRFNEERQIEENLYSFSLSSDT
ncbi:NRDE family protein [Desemzia sp. FAM 23991]|uniref:NRDE family protein n=1 Tax=unclassified Desemzia TaxID=2685243 RepID=UPI003888908F